MTSLLPEPTVKGAVDAAVAVGRESGLEVQAPRVLSQSGNVVVALDPAPVVARVCGVLGPLRPDRGGEHMRREMALMSWAAERGGPVTPPSSRIDPGPHLRDGYWLGFWEPGEDPGVVSTAEAEPILRELHELIAGYDGELRTMAPVIDDVPPMLAEAVERGGLTRDAADMVSGRLAGLQTRLLTPPLDVQPLHGDAQPHNLLRIDGRLVWNDFEECCIGPVEWDLVCLHRGWQDVPMPDLSGYRAGIDPEALEPFIEARMIQGAAFVGLLARDDAARRARLDDLLERLAEL